jgi:hypothetical protein
MVDGLAAMVIVGAAVLGEAAAPLPQDVIVVRKKSAMRKRKTEHER